MALENLLLEETQEDHESQFPQVVSTFFRLFSNLLMLGNEAHIARAKNGKRPRVFTPEFYGWKPSEENRWTPKGNLIGWVSDDGEIYLSPHDAFDALEFWAAFKGPSLGYTQRGLWKALAGHQVIIRGDGGNQPKRWVCGEYKRVIHLPASSVTAWIARGNEEDTRWWFNVLKNRD